MELCRVAKSKSKSYTSSYMVSFVGRSLIKALGSLSTCSPSYIPIEQTRQRQDGTPTIPQRPKYPEEAGPESILV
jgi:hypothetical protein